MSSDSEGVDDILCITPENVEKVNITDIATHNSLLPEKSRQRYEFIYQKFMEWRLKNNSKSISEDLLLAYFEEISKEFKPSSLWATYSMLRSMINIKHNTNIANYQKLRAFLKTKNSGFKSKKSTILTFNQITEFLQNAPDDKYLFMKVALIIGVNGACRQQEMRNIKPSDLEDTGKSLIIRICDMKTNLERFFIVSGTYYVICKKYMNLRPPGEHVKSLPFFLNYQNGKCTMQTVGINKFGRVPKQIALYLGLPNPENYTGHCFRRSSTSILVNAGGGVLTLKKKDNEDEIFNMQKKVYESPYDPLCVDSSCSGSQDLVMHEDYLQIKIEEPPCDPSCMVSNSSETKKNLNDEESTPLIFAIQCGNIETIRTLLNEDVDVCKPGPRGETPLLVSVQKGDLDIIKLLLENGAEHTMQTALLEAISLCNFEVVKYFLEQNAFVNVAYSSGYTPLTKAIEMGNLDIVKELVENGARVNMPNREKQFPLNLAVQKGNLEIIKFLLAKEKPPDSILDKCPFLLKCIEENNVELLEMLTNLGVNLDVVYDNGSTPLSRAVEMEKFKLVTFLVEKGANINLTNKNGLSPLAIAASKQNLRITKFLISCSANIDDLAKKELDNYASANEDFAIYMDVLKGTYMEWDNNPDTVVVIKEEFSVTN